LRPAQLALRCCNQRSVAPGFESGDVLDGDEIRSRLILLNDDKAPTLLDVTRAAISSAFLVVPPRRPSLALGRPAPRGPPSVPSSRA
jgi:hypothetical protein